MVIRSRVVTSASAFQPIFDAIDLGQDIAHQALVEATAKHEPRLREVLEFEPPKSSAPITFTSDKQRRFVGWAKRTGRIPTDAQGRSIRSRRMVNAWNIVVSQTNEGSQLVISNAEPYTKFVVGSFAERQTFQQRWLATRGWKPVKPGVDQIVQDVQDDATDTFNALLRDQMELLSRRQNR